MIRTWKQQQAFERALRAEWLQSMADTGDYIEVCAKKAGLPAPSVRNMARIHGVTFVKCEINGKRPVLTKAVMQDCLAKGLTTAESARALGVSEGAIYHARKRHGITLPLHPKFQK